MDTDANDVIRAMAALDGQSLLIVPEAEPFAQMVPSHSLGRYQYSEDNSLRIRGYLPWADMFDVLYSGL